MEERKIAIWNSETLDWTTKEFLEQNSKYRVKGENHEFYVWETFLYAAELMGLKRNDIEFLFEENKDLAVVDLLFSMFLLKLFGRSYAKEYLADGKVASISMIHNLIRDAEGYVIDGEKAKGKNAEAPVNEAMSEIEKYLKEIVADNSEMQEKMESVMAELTKKLEAFSAATKKNGQSQKSEAKTDEEAKKLQKLEVDNLVLKYQLEHKDELTQLQMKLAEKEAELKRSEEKRQEMQKKQEEDQKQSEESTKELKKKHEAELQQAEEKYQELLKKYEVLEKKDDERHAEYLSLFKAYEMVVEANTKQLSELLPYRIFHKKDKDQKS